MFATYVPHLFRSDRAGVGKGSISIWFGKHFHSIFSLSFEQKKQAFMTRPVNLRKRREIFLPNRISSPQVFTRNHLQPFCVGGVASQLSHYYRRWRPDRSEELAMFAALIGSSRLARAGPPWGSAPCATPFSSCWTLMRGGTTRPQPQCCILHKIYYILWFQAQANSKILISHTQIRTRYQNPSKGCASQALFGVKNFGL